MARGLEPAYIDGYRLGYVSSGYYAHSVSIPILDGMAQSRSVRFRRLTPDHPRKYETLGGDQSHLFNVSSLRHHVVHLTEGEFDAIVLEQVGHKAIGVPGINNFRREWRWLFLGNEVRIVFDSDERGTPAYTSTRQAVGQIRKLLEPLCDKVDEVELPEGHDVSSLYVADRDTFDRVFGEGR